MRKIDDTYVFSRVPNDAKVSFIDVTLVSMGMTAILFQFMLGATLGNSMIFWEKMIASYLGSLLLEAVSFGIGFAGIKEGLSTSLLSRWCSFGRIGSLIVSIIIAVNSIG